MMNLADLTLAAAVDSVKKGEVKASEILDYYVARMAEDKAHKLPVNAVVWADEKAARKELEAVKKDAPLAGLPLLIKDNMNASGQPAQCGSKILEGYISPFDGGAVENARKEGMIIFGRSNMDEFAMGSSTETSVHGVTRNPVDRGRIPGGSSGGAAAAIAGDLALAALGSDTGGSIRQPAALCGVTGLKPTYGRVSRWGLVAYGSSLDQIGPIARTAEDCAILLSVVAGFDQRDSTSVNLPVPDYRSEISKPVKGMKIGLPKECFAEGLSNEIRASIMAASEFYKKAGCDVREVSLPHTKYSVPTYYIIATAEASANLARFDGVRYGRRAEAEDLRSLYIKSRSEGFGEEVKRRILLGTYVLSSGYYDAYYKKAQKVRRLIKNDFDNVFKEVDVLLMPSVPETAFKFGEKSDDPVSMYLSDIYTTSLNLSGVPGISVPCGKDKNGLPIGMQIAGRHFDEASVLRLAHFYQANGGAK